MTVVVDVQFGNDLQFIAGSKDNWEDTTTRELTVIVGFTLKIDNEIVGLTKHHDHTHERLLSMSLVKEGKISQ